MADAADFEDAREHWRRLRARAEATDALADFVLLGQHVPYAASHDIRCAGCSRVWGACPTIVRISLADAEVDRG